LVTAGLAVATTEFGKIAKSWETFLYTPNIFSPMDVLLEVALLSLKTLANNILRFSN